MILDFLPVDVFDKFLNVKPCCIPRMNLSWCSVLFFKQIFYISFLVLCLRLLHL